MKMCEEYVGGKVMEMSLNEWAHDLIRLIEAGGIGNV